MVRFLYPQVMDPNTDTVRYYFDKNEYFLIRSTENGSVSASCPMLPADGVCGTLSKKLRLLTRKRLQVFRWRTLLRGLEIASAQHNGRWESDYPKSILIRERSRLMSVPRCMPSA